jgi:hypothetical protein
VLNGTTFTNASFDIRMFGDNSNIIDFFGTPIIDPLNSAKITIAGLGTGDFLTATRFGLNGTNNVFFFSEKTIFGGVDLFDFSVSAADAASFNFQAGYGPVSALSVSALNQFENISTSIGPLSLNSASNVSFSSVSPMSAVPGPVAGAGLPGLAAGLGAFFVWWRRRDALRTV